MDRVRERILLLAEQGLGGLLRLYPRAFRRRYGREIARTFSQLARERLRNAGLGGLLWLELRTLTDTVAAAVREHWDSLRERIHGSGARRRDGPVRSFGRDLRFALRCLARRPGFSLAIVLTLALGIGANTAIFSVIYAALLRPLPYENGDRVVSLRHLYGDGEDENFSLAELDALRERSRTLQAVELHHSMSFILLGDTVPERVETGVVSTGFFELLGVEPLLGRGFDAGDVHHPVLVAAYSYWHERLGGDPDVVGRKVRMNDRDHTIVGVLPPLPPYPSHAEVFMPLLSCPFRRRHVDTGDPYRRMDVLIARLAPGVTIAQAQEEVARIVRGVEAGSSGPGVSFESESQGIRIVSAGEELARDARPTFLVLLATVVFVLLTVCANAANLTLARLVSREREMVLRTALGAGRGRLVRQLMTESLLLATLAGVVGLAVAVEMLGRLQEFAARLSLRADDVRIDGVVLGFTVAMVLLTGVLLGILPALPRWRHLVQALQYGSWGRFLGHGRQRLQRLLVVVQLALSFVLLVAAGLMVRTLTKLHEVDPGFRAENVLTMTVDLNWSRYEDEDEFRGFFTELVDELSQREGVESAAVARTFPLHDRSPYSGSLLIEGFKGDGESLSPQVDIRQVSEDYFETLGIELVEGRGFAVQDDLGAPPAVIVNRSLARRYFGCASPLDRRVSIDEGRTWSTIVGVVGDVKQRGLAADVLDEVYAPVRQHASRQMMILVRTRADPQRAARQMRQAVSELDSQQAIAQLRTLEQIRQDTLAPPRSTTLLLALFAAFALFLTAAGVCGTLTFFVSQRTREIGVRMVLGAGRSRVLRMVLGEAMGLASLGLVIGLLGAPVLSRLMAELLYGVEPIDPWTFLVTAVVLFVVAASAGLVPARWASSIQPVEALRQD